MVARNKSFLWALIVGSALWVGCSDEPARPSAGTPGDSGSQTVPSSTSEPQAPRESTAPSKEPSTDELIAAGRSVYNANCIACHGLDPTKDGALGPAVAGSSLALLEARVLRAEYPEGYTPKRNTRVMVALPHLEPRLPELAAYLNFLD